MPRRSPTKRVTSATNAARRANKRSAPEPQPTPGSSSSRAKKRLSYTENERGTARRNERVGGGPSVGAATAAAEIQTPPRKRAVVGSATQDYTISPPLRATLAAGRVQESHGPVLGSPGKFSQSGPDGSNPSSILMAQRSIQTSQEAVKDVFKKGVNELHAKFSTLEKTLGSRMELQEENMNLLLRFLSSQTKNKDTKARVNVQLAPFSTIYSGSFYSRMFGMQFVVTLLKATKEAVVDEAASIETRTHVLVDSVRNVLHALVFRRMSSEKSREGLSKSVAYARGSRFRRDLCLSMIRTAETNESIGTEKLLIGGETRTVPRPAWLRKGFVKKSVIDELVTSCDLTFGKGSSKAATTTRRNTESMGGTLWDEAVEREQLGEEIVRRLHQRHVQQMNKSREYVRNDLFPNFGFLWHNEAKATITASPSLTLEMSLEDIPLADVWKSGDESKTRTKNLGLWREMVDSLRNSMTATVEYEVETYATKEFLGEGKLRTIHRSINLLLLSLSLCTRFTMCFKPDDFFAMHSGSMRAVYCIALVFREILYQRERDPIDLPQDDVDMGEEDVRSLSNLILDLVPSFSSKRRALLYQNVLRITDDEFEKLHIGEQENYDGHGSDDFMSEDVDPSEDGSEDEDEEILAMRTVNFRG